MACATLVTILHVHVAQGMLALVSRDFPPLAGFIEVLTEHHVTT